MLKGTYLSRLRHNMVNLRLKCEEASQHRTDSNFVKRVVPDREECPKCYTNTHEDLLAKLSSEDQVRAQDNV